LAAKRDLILEHGWVLLLATVLLHLGGFAGGYWGSFLLGREKIERQTLSIEVGMQNSGLCTECDRSLCGGKFIGIEMGQRKRSKKDCSLILFARTR